MQTPSKRTAIVGERVGSGIVKFFDERKGFGCVLVVGKSDVRIDDRGASNIQPGTDTPEYTGNPKGMNKPGQNDQVTFIMSEDGHRAEQWGYTRYYAKAIEAIDDKPITRVVGTGTEVLALTKSGRKVWMPLMTTPVPAVKLEPKKVRAQKPQPPKVEAVPAPKKAGKNGKVVLRSLGDLQTLLVTAPD